MVQKLSLSPLLATVALLMRNRWTVKLEMVKAGYSAQRRSM